MGRPRPPFPPSAQAPPHLVELSLARLDEERPRPAARPYVGERGRGEARRRARGARALPELDSAVRPRPAGDRVRPVTGGRAVARAIDALRRGWPILLGGVPLLAIETADEPGLADFDAGAPADLLIAGNRAVTLKLANQRDGVPTGPVRVERAS